MRLSWLSPRLPIPPKTANMLGVNALAMFTRDRARLLRMRAGCFVVMDAPEVAQTLKAANPRAVVVHRSYRPDDHRLYETVSPAYWLQSVALTAGNGVVVQALNEPSGYTNLPTLVTWCVEVMKQAHERGMPLCLPNFAVGHPDTQAVANGVLDPLLRAFVAYPEHWLGLHEYWRDDPLNEPYHVGRFHAILDRCRVLGITLPRICITEMGRDVAGQIGDGWRGVGYSEREYAALLTRTHARVYAPHGIPAAVFCYGHGADNRWASFDLEGAETVLQAIEEYNMTQTPTEKRTAFVRIVGGVNLRPQPTTAQAKIATIPQDAEISVWLQPVSSSDGFEWVAAQWGEQRGYVAVEVRGTKTFEVVDAPPIEIPEPALCSPFLTDEEHQQFITAITRMEAASGELRAAFGELRTLWTRALERKQAA